jgi:hypothetical protein
MHYQGVPRSRGQSSETHGRGPLLDRPPTLCKTELTRVHPCLRFLSPLPLSLSGGLLDNPPEAVPIMKGPGRELREPCQPIPTRSAPGPVILRPQAGIPPKRSQTKGAAASLTESRLCA